MTASLAWGGFKNGCIPDAFLTVVRGERFEKEAASYLVVLEAAFTQHFGYPAIILEGYRDLARQDALWAAWLAWLHNTGPKANLAAYPGTSNHGFARAADFASGIDQFGSQEKEWMNQNAPTFGWHPSGDSFYPREAWHFEYFPGTAAGTPAELAAKLEDDLMATPAEREALIKDLLNYAAFTGGPTVSEMLVEAHEVYKAVTRPVKRDGRDIEQIQDNADTNTMVRALLAKAGVPAPVDEEALANAIIAKLPLTTVPATVGDVTQAVESAIAGLTLKATS